MGSKWNPMCPYWKEAEEDCHPEKVRAQELDEARGMLSPRASRGSWPADLIQVSDRFWTSGVQKCEDRFLLF